MTLEIFLGYDSEIFLNVQNNDDDIDLSYLSLGIRTADEIGCTQTQTIQAITVEKNWLWNWMKSLLSLPSKQGSLE